MSAWHGKSKGTPLGYRIFVWVLKSFGVLPAYFLLRIVVVYYFFFSYKASRQIYLLYRRKLGYSCFSSVAKLYKNYFLLGQGIIDKVVLMSGIKNNFGFEFDGEENLHKIAAMGKGGILLSAHIGNWDVAGHLLAHIKSRINIVMYDGEHERIKEYLEGVTGKRNMSIIVIKNDLSHIYKISEALSNNELVCMHADRFLEGNKTLTAHFLGEPARFPMGPFLLASKFKVPVSYVFAVKESNLHYHLFSSPVKDYSTVAKDDVMQQMLTEYVAEIEKKIKKYPEQWFNYYDFWEQKKMITINDIEILIPQRPPFVMIDKLLSVTDTTATTGFSIKENNIFVENGTFKEPGLVENIAQTAAANAGYISHTENKPVLVGYIGAVNNLQVFALPKTGDELITEITTENQIFDVSLISGKITCNGVLIAQCKMKIFINQLKN